MLAYLTCVASSFLNRNSLKIDGKFIEHILKKILQDITIEMSYIKGDH